MVRAKRVCVMCGGSGWADVEYALASGLLADYSGVCPRCEGTGYEYEPDYEDAPVPPSPRWVRAYRRFRRQGLSPDEARARANEYHMAVLARWGRIYGPIWRSRMADCDPFAESVL